MIENLWVPEILENLWRNEKELYEYVLSGNYDDENSCYKFISRVKWPDGYVCNNKSCVRHNVVTIEYKEITPEVKKRERKFKNEIPYSRKCLKCPKVESPTANTRIDSFKRIQVLYELVHLLISQRSRGRLSNDDIDNIMNKRKEKQSKRKEKISGEGLFKNVVKAPGIVTIYGKYCSEIDNAIQNHRSELRDLNVIIQYFDILPSNKVKFNKVFYEEIVSLVGNEKEKLVTYKEAVVATLGVWERLEECENLRPKNTIGIGKIDEYRFMMQQYFTDISNGRSSSNNIYGVEKFWLCKGDVRKLIVVIRHQCPNGHVRCLSFDTDGKDVIENCVNDYIPEGSRIVFYHFEEKFQNDFAGFSNIEFDKYFIDFDIHPYLVSYVTFKVKEWFLGTTQRDALADTVKLLSLGGVNQVENEPHDPFYLLKKIWYAYPDHVITSLKINNDDTLMLHINECIFVNFYDNLDTAVLLSLLIQNPSKELHPRRELKAANIGVSPFAKQPKLYND